MRREIERQYSDDELHRSQRTVIGLIGYGNIGRVHHEALVSSIRPRFSVEGISDLSFDSFAFSKDRTPLYRSFRELLDRPDITAVSINTPPNTHLELVVEALKAGKHVLVEKPPALTVQQCQIMIDVARERERVLFMAFHARYNKAVEGAKEKLKEKRIKKIEIRYAEWVFNYHKFDGWVFKPEVSGGGVLMDSGVNALSIVNYILPDIHLDPISSKFESTEGLRVETAAKINFVFDQDAQGVLDMSWVHQGPEVREIYFLTDEEDEYKVDIVRSELLKNGVILVSNGDELRDLVDQHSEYRMVYEDFSSHIQEGKSLISLEELAFIEKAYQFA